MANRRKQRSDRRRGAIAVLVAVCLTVVVAIMAISLDGGMLLEDRRIAQATADAAALAAASQLFEDYPQYSGWDINGVAKQHALLIIAENAGPDAEATINIPPKSGDHVGENGYVEVIIDIQQNRFFSAIFQGGDLTIKARSVARGLWESIDASLIALEPKKRKGLDVKKGSFLAIEGDIIVNSNNKGEAAKIDSSSTVVAKNIYITGGYKGSFSGNVSTGEAPTPDPLRDLEPPDPLSMPLRSSPKSKKGKESKGGKTYELFPGRYTKELKFQNNDIVIMHPGIYYLEKGLRLRRDSTLVGNNVMLYNGSSSGKKSRQIKIEHGSSISLTPPTSGPYAGISIFQGRDSRKTIEFKQRTKVNISGTIYAPNAKIHFKTNFYSFDDLDDEDYDDDELYDQEEDDDDDDDSDVVGEKYSNQIIARQIKLDKGAHLDLRGVNISSRNRSIQIVE